jgi:hypothetical protein
VNIFICFFMFYTSAGGLSLPKSIIRPVVSVSPSIIRPVVSVSPSIIRPVVSVSTQTWFIIYIYY